MTDTSPETVLLPSRARKEQSAHLPRDDDPDRPRCGSDCHSSHDWRSLPRDHSLVRDREICKMCAGEVERPETRDPSLRELVARGEIGASCAESEGGGR